MTDVFRKIPLVIAAIILQIVSPTRCLAQNANVPFYPGIAHFPSDPITNSVAGIDSTSGTLREFNGYVWAPLAPIQNNYAGSGAPTANNDLTQGYSVNSLWYNTNNSVWSIATSVAKGAANWQTFNSGGGGGSPGGSNGQVQYNNGGSFGGLTSTQLTADLNVFSSTLQGAVPASGGGTTNFLRADGTFAAPSGGGGGNTTATYLTAADETGSLANSIGLQGKGTGSPSLILDPTRTSLASGANSMSLGFGSQALGDSSVCFGLNAQTVGSGSVAIGTQAGTSQANDTCIGYAATTDAATGGNNTVIGCGANVGAGSGGNGVAIGFNSGVSSTEGVAIGTAAMTSGFTGVCIGPGSISSGTQSIALGQGSNDDGRSFVSSIGASGVNRVLIHVQHVESANNAAPTIAAGAGAGTSPTVSVTGTDTAGVVSIATGSSPSASAVVATITFNVPFQSAPRVVFAPASANAANTSIYATSTTTTFVLNAGTTPLGAGTFLLNYQVIQ